MSYNHLRLSINFGSSIKNGTCYLYMTTNCCNNEIIKSLYEAIKILITRRNLDMKLTYDIHLISVRKFISDEFMTYKIKSEFNDIGEFYHGRFHQLRLAKMKPSKLYRTDTFEYDDNLEIMKIEQPVTFDFLEAKDLEYSLLREVLMLNKDNITKYNIILQLLRKEKEFKRKYYHYWQDSRSMRTHKKIQYGRLYDIKYRVKIDDIKLHYMVRNSTYNQIVGEYTEHHQKQIVIQKVIMNDNDFRIRKRALTRGESVLIGDPIKVDEDLVKMLFIENTYMNTSKILSGLEKNVYGCLVNIYRMCPFLLSNIYYSRSHRSFYIFVLDNGVYYELDTHRVRTISLFKLYDVHMRKSDCFIKRTKTSLKAYGHLFKSLCRVESMESMPHITHQSDFDRYSVDQLKAWFWIKIYSKKDKRNVKSDRAFIIRDPCWSYTKIGRCDNLLFGSGSSFFEFDYSKRYNR